MPVWLTTAISIIKLLVLLGNWAQESRLKGEGFSDAISRIVVEATRLIEAARKARAGVDADARAGKLRDDDGFRRD